MVVNDVAVDIGEVVVIGDWLVVEVLSVGIGVIPEDVVVVGGSDVVVAVGLVVVIVVAGVVVLAAGVVVVAGDVAVEVVVAIGGINCIM